MSYRHECQAVFQDPYAAFNPFFGSITYSTWR